MPSRIAAAVTSASAIAPFWLVVSMMRTLVRVADGKCASLRGANLTAPVTEHRYDPREIEPKWQAVWEREQTWHVSNDDVGDAEKSYVLEMLPYPSGEPHMGHLKNYSVGD